MTTDLKALSELFVHAENLEHNMHYEDASEAFLVLADAAEERGEMKDARDLRRRALRNYVTVWARERWPREGIHVMNVTTQTLSPRARRSRIDLYVWRRVAGRGEHVSVGRKGDVRLEKHPRDHRPPVTRQGYAEWSGRARLRGGDGEG